MTLKVSIKQPAGVKITVGAGNKPLTFAKNATKTFPITISAPDVANGQYFARISLIPPAGGGIGDDPGRLREAAGQGEPVEHVLAAEHREELRSLALHRDGAEPRHGRGEHEHQGGEPERVDVINGLGYRHVASPGTVIGAGTGVQWSGSLSPALAPPVNAINDITGAGPDGGYLALSLFGVASIGAGDDTITNFTVPTFYYGGEPYTRIGVVSNGYIVVGGGDSGDIVFTPQHFPNAARPNNTIAPLWSDLNPAGGGAVRVATLSGGGFAWIVIDWDNVKNFGNATTHSFEIWLQESTGAHTGPASEGITFSYGPNLSFPSDGPGLANAGSGDPDSGQNWGAENRDGSSGLNIASAPVNGHEYQPVLSGPMPGGSVSLAFDVFGKKTGSWFSDASMTSNQTVGTTIASQKITVTP